MKPNAFRLGLLTYMDVGSADFRWRITQNQQMDQALTQRQIGHEFHLTAGWHNWNVWRNNIQQSLPRLGQFWQHSPTQNRQKLDKIG